MTSSLLLALFRSGAAVVLMCACTAAMPEMSRIRMGSKSAEVIMAKITVSDLQRSLDFYTRIANLKEVDIPGMPKAKTQNPDADIIQVMLNASGSAADAMLCLVKQKGVTPTQESARLTSIVLMSQDARAVVDRAKAAGFTIKSQPREFRGVVEGAVADPDGYIVAFVEAQGVAARGSPE